MRVLVVGLGNMGLSRALAYQKLDGFEIVGLVARGINDRTDLPESFGNYPGYTDFDVALSATRPDAISINSWRDTCAEFAIEAGAFDYEDVRGKHMLGDCRIEPRMLVIGGRVWHGA